MPERKLNARLHNKIVAALIELGDDRKEGFAEVLDVMKHSIDSLANSSSESPISLPDVILAFTSATASITQLLSLVSTTSLIIESIELGVATHNKTIEGWRCAFFQANILDVRRNFAKLKIEFSMICNANGGSGAVSSSGRTGTGIKTTTPESLVLLGERAMRVGRLVFTLWESFGGLLKEYDQKSRTLVDTSLDKQTPAWLLKGMSLVANSILSDISATAIQGLVPPLQDLLVQSSHLILLFDSVVRGVQSESRRFNTQSNNNVDENLFLLEISLQEVANGCVLVLVHCGTTSSAQAAASATSAAQELQQSLLDVLDIVEDVKKGLKTGWRGVPKRRLRSSSTIVEQEEEETGATLDYEMIKVGEDRISVNNVESERELVLSISSTHNLLAIPLTEWVDRITHWNPRFNDPSLKKTLLLVWSSFMPSPAEMVTVLIKHYNNHLEVPAGVEHDEDAYIAQVMEPTRKATLTFMIEWILSDHHAIIACSSSSGSTNSANARQSSQKNKKAAGAIKELNEFTSFCLGIVVEVEELLLVKQLVAALAGELVLPTSSITKYGERLESLQISAMTTNATTEPAAANKPVTSLLQVSANAIADQLKRIDFEIYERITASELLLDQALPGLSGGGSNNRKPNLLAFQHRFNFIVGLVTTTIIKLESPKLRAVMISHIIKVAKRCWEIKSLNSGLAIVSALTSASIFRLSNTWSKVSKIGLDEFETVKAWFSHKSNWSSLRSVVASTCPESTCCVPFLGFFIHDIIFIKESQEPMFGGGGGGGSGPGAAEKVNLSRCRLLERVVDSALKFQKAKLVVAQKTNGALREFLMVEKGLYITQSSQFAASLMVESRDSP